MLAGRTDSSDNSGTWLSRFSDSVYDALSQFPDWLINQTFVFGAFFLGAFPFLKLGVVFTYLGTSIPAIVSVTTFLIHSLPIIALLGGLLTAYSVKKVYENQNKDKDNAAKESPLKIIQFHFFELYTHVTLGKWSDFLIDLTSELFSFIKGSLTGYATYAVLAIHTPTLWHITFSASPPLAIALSIMVGVMTYIKQETKLNGVGRKLWGRHKNKDGEPSSENLSVVFQDLMRDIRAQLSRSGSTASVVLKQMFHISMFLGHMGGQAGGAYLALTGFFAIAGVTTLSTSAMALCTLGAFGISVYCGFFYGFEYMNMMMPKSDTLAAGSEAGEKSTWQSHTVEWALVIFSSIAKGTLGGLGIYTFFVGAISLPFAPAVGASVFVCIATAFLQGNKLASVVIVGHKLPLTPAFAPLEADDQDGVPPLSLLDLGASAVHQPPGEYHPAALATPVVRSTKVTSFSFRRESSNSQLFQQDGQGGQQTQPNAAPAHQKKDAHQDGSADEERDSSRSAHSPVGANSLLLGGT